MTASLRDISIAIATVMVLLLALTGISLYIGVRAGYLRYPGHWYVVNLYGLLIDFAGAILLAITETNWFELRAEAWANRTEGGSRGWNKLESNDDGSLEPGSDMYDAFIDISKSFELGVDDPSTIVRFEDGIIEDDAGNIDYYIYQITESGDRVRMVDDGLLYEIIEGRLSMRQDSIQDTAVSVSSSILAIGFFLTLTSFFVRNFVM